MKTFYTYELIDSRTNLVFYIGKGSNNRMYVHYNAIINNNKITNNKLENKIRSIYKNNGYIIYNKIEALNEQDAFDTEIELIKFYRNQNLDLCNLTDGGEGISGHTFKHSKETKEKISLRLKGKEKTEEHINELKKAKKDNINNTKYWKNKKFDNKHKEKLSISAKNRQKMSDETKQKISKNNKSKLNKGKTHTEIFGKEKSEKMAQANREKHLNKKASNETKQKMSLAQLGINHPKAKVYIINKNGIISEEKSTLKILSEKLNLKICTIQNIIKNNKTINNININVK